MFFQVKKYSKSIKNDNAFHMKLCKQEGKYIKRRDQKQ